MNKFCLCDTVQFEQAPKTGSSTITVIRNSRDQQTSLCTGAALIYSTPCISAVVSYWIVLGSHLVLAACTEISPNQRFGALNSKPGGFPKPDLLGSF